MKQYETLSYTFCCQLCYILCTFAIPAFSQDALYTFCFGVSKVCHMHVSKLFEIGDHQSYLVSHGVLQSCIPWCVWCFQSLNTYSIRKLHRQWKSSEILLGVHELLHRRSAAEFGVRAEDETVQWSMTCQKPSKTNQPDQWINGICKIFRNRICIVSPYLVLGVHQGALPTEWSRRHRHISNARIWRVLISSIWFYRIFSRSSVQVADKFPILNLWCP